MKSRLSGERGCIVSIRNHPWIILCTMVVAQAATTIVTSAPAFLIPMLHAEQEMSLALAGLLAGMPSLGLVATLVLWGAATDRWGERRVLLIGLSLTVLATALSVMAVNISFGFLAFALVMSGAMAACTNSASGRLITGWFPPNRRGLAMGIRQTCQPIGIAVASLSVPPLAAQFGVPAALAFGGALTLVAAIACAIFVNDPSRAASTTAVPMHANPYRGSSVLVRIHLVSLLLVVPQFALSIFGLVWFTLEFGWSAAAAGALVATAQLLGAAGRIAVGVWSDRLGSRMRPLRWVAILAAVSLLSAAGFGAMNWAAAAAIAYIIASCLSVADNGLAFTAVAEMAGPRWAGKALGIQNTGQFATAAAVGPVVGGLIALFAVPGAFALVALAPIIAIPLVPSARVEQLAGPIYPPRKVELNNAGARINTEDQP